MTVPRIGWDIDGTVADIDPVWKAFLACKFDIVAPQYFTKYDFWRDMGLTHEDAFSVIPQVLKQVHLIKMYPTVKWTLTKYHKATQSPLIFLTARTADNRQATKDWLDRNVPEYLVYENLKTGMDKAVAARATGLQVVVEDNYENAVVLYEQGFHVYLVNRPWNIGFNTDNLNAKRFRRINRLADMLVDTKTKLTRVK